MSEAVIALESVSKTYGSGAATTQAVSDVSMSVARGTWVAIMGPSGHGKSTLLQLIGGLDRPSAGRIVLDGAEIGSLDATKLAAVRGRKIGFVFQFFNLIPVLDAVENASLPLRLDGARDAAARATAWLTRVGLGDRLHNRPDQLSGGQQQRVAIARALSTDPALVLADEPTGNLDSRSATEIGELLRQISSEWGRSVLMVTHDPRIAAFAQRLVLMRDGRVVDDLPLDGSREGPRQALERSGLL